MERNRFWYLNVVGWLLGTLAFLLLIAFPVILNLLVITDRYPLALARHLDKIQFAQAYAMRGLGFAWIFFLGSCFASFLNVVAWRIPRGRSINGSSHCPRCNVKLKFTDNLPVFGWLRNQGKCRSCKLPIPVRYLVVEVWLGLLFVILASAEVLSGGLSLPFRPVNHLRGFEHVAFAPQWDLIQIWLYHCVLACFLFTFAMVRSEKVALPFSIVLAAILAGLLLPFAWPAMLVIPWNQLTNQYTIIDRFSVAQLLTLGSGLTGGTFVGVLVARLIQKANDPELSRLAPIVTVNEVVASFLIVGIFLGWQSAILVGAMTFVLAIYFGGQKLELDAGSDTSDRQTADSISEPFHVPGKARQPDTVLINEIPGGEEVAIGEGERDGRSTTAHPEKVDVPTPEVRSGEETSVKDLQQPIQSVTNESPSQPENDQTQNLLIKSPFGLTEKWQHNLPLLILIAVIIHLLTWRMTLGAIFQ